MTTPFSRTALALALALSLGCSPDREAQTYTTPKESTAPTPPMLAATPDPMRTNAADAMRNQALPADALNTHSANPTWSAPADWREQPPSAMRRATFVVSGPDGPADLAVTTFPGDVGGLLANVNRWRGQIGLPPTSEDALPQSVSTLDINGKTAHLIELTSQPNSTLAAIFSHDGNAWFFKLTGPAATVAANADAFNRFIHSIAF